MKPILVIPSGVLSAKEKKDIDEAGYVTIVTDEPEKIKFISPNKGPDAIMDVAKETALYVLYNCDRRTDEYIRLKEWFSVLLMEKIGVKKQ